MYPEFNSLCLEVVNMNCLLYYVSPKDEDHRRDPSPDRSDLGEDRGRKARYRKGPHMGLSVCVKLITYSSSVHISLESFDLIWNNSNFKLIFTSDCHHLMFIGDVLVLFCFMLIVVFFFIRKA